MTVTIYKLNASPPARAVLMTAEILNLDYKAVDIDILKGDHLNPDFVKKNHLHQLPYLEDGDFGVTDSHAIITYLISAYGGELREKLYPSEIKIRATIDSRLHFDASVLFARVQRIGYTVLVEKKSAPTEKHIADITQGYEFLERYLEQTKYVAADFLTVADIACLATISSSDTLVPVDPRFKKIHQWWNGFKSEEWYKKINEPGVKDYIKAVKILKDSNINV